MTIDGHTGGVAVENFQPLGHVGHSDPGTAEASWPFQQSGRTHAYAVIFDFDNQV